jgi:hypothetical protein
MHSGDCPFTCSACNKSFRLKSLLISHQRKHKW